MKVGGRYRIREVHLDTFAHMANPVEGDSSTLSKEDTKRVQEAMMRLPDDQYSVMVSVAQGLSFAEMARLLGESPGWVSHRFQKGRDRMVAELEDIFG